jgi:hypothetical protein
LRRTVKDDDYVKDNDSKDNINNGKDNRQGQQQPQDNDSKDNGDVGKDDNNDGGNGDSSGGGGKIGGEVGSKVGGMVGGMVGGVGVTIFSGACQQNFCWRGSFAGTTIASKIAPAKFKMRQ